MSFTDLLAELKVEYVSGLPQKIETIREHQQSKDLIALRTDWHKLKGNGTTYGLPEISELATVVESHCLENPDSALEAVGSAIEILCDIHFARLKNTEHSLTSDPRFQALCGQKAAA